MPAKKITIHVEPADGLPEQVTGVHIDHGDGSASWLTGPGLDTKPTGSPRTWREIGLRANADGKTAPKFVTKAAPPRAPAPGEFSAGAVEPAP